MAKVKNPTTFADYFKLPPEKLAELGVFNPTLAIDIKLFIDPLLLSQSQHDEICITAVKIYREHFKNIIKLLAASKKFNDVHWRNARRLFQFHEIEGTCLGYGAGSISGSGFGIHLINRVMRTGKEIVDLGIDDPDLFVVMALFEEDIGPDRISDMTTNVIFKALIDFNQRILSELDIPTRNYTYHGDKIKFATNPFHKKRIPIILIPRDILKKLPIATSWDDIQDVAHKNQLLRDKVNSHIAQIWATKSKRDKTKLKMQALSSKEAFQTLLDSIHQIPTQPYDLEADPLGLIKWAEVAKLFSERFPLQIPTPATLNLDTVYNIILQIISQFRQLVENNGLWKNLWYKNKPLYEKYTQRLFFAISYSYCKANNIEISPEVDSGTGQVDFKFSTGFNSRVLVEIKLSTNSKLISGYKKQIEAYKLAEETMRAIYLVVDVGYMHKKDEQLLKIQSEFLNKGFPVSELEFVDAKRKRSASNL